MLNFRENEVMNTVYALCQDGGVCLVSATELLSMLPSRRHYTEAQLEKILNALALDDYFQLLSSQRQGEKTYAISLRAGGYAYKRSALQKRRDFLLKCGWAILSAVIAFAVGFFLKRIF